MADPTAYGFLKVFVTTAGAAIPLSDALVTVSRLENGQTVLLHTARTDRSGQTPVFTLETPPAAYSEAPGNPPPYAYYIVEVSRDGYVPTARSRIPMYAGIQGVLPVLMVPLGVENQPQVYVTSGENPPNL